MIDKIKLGKYSISERAELAHRRRTGELNGRFERARRAVTGTAEVRRLRTLYQIKATSRTTRFSSLRSRAQPLTEQGNDEWRTAEPGPRVAYEVRRSQYEVPNAKCFVRRAERRVRVLRTSQAPRSIAPASLPVLRTTP
jgi:hypothetical protein